MQVSVFSWLAGYRLWPEPELAGQLAAGCVALSGAAVGCGRLLARPRVAIMIQDCGTVQYIAERIEEQAP